MENKFLGQWAWEGTDSDQRKIEFFEENFRIHLKVIERNDSFTIKSLELENNDTNDGGHYWHFSNLWLDSDGKQLFGLESRFAENSGLTGTFTNTSIFQLADDNKMKQIWQGYRFDNLSQTWVHFNKEIFLNRVV